MAAEFEAEAQPFSHLLSPVQQRHCSATKSTALYRHTLALCSQRSPQRSELASLRAFLETMRRWLYAIVAAVAALIVAGMIAARKVEGHRSAGHEPQPPAGFDLTGKIVDIVRERPIMSIGLGLAAGIFALKNPSLTATVAKAFLDPKPPQR